MGWSQHHVQLVKMLVSGWICSIYRSKAKPGWYSCNSHSETDGFCSGKPNPAVNPFPYNPDYAYQDQTVEAMVKVGGMIAQVATGGGKSNIACKAAARIGRMTLFITTRSVLMFQMAENFQNPSTIELKMASRGLRAESWCDWLG
jgi:superfamily II DNA or RNA helicase